MSVDKKKRQAEHARKHYLANKEKCKARAKHFTKITTLKNRELSERYRKLVGCKRCGYNECIQALEYHHVGVKDRNVSLLVGHGCSTKRVKNEIRKCIVLCTNCHRELHAAE